MGGTGSGRWAWHTKAVAVENCAILSIRDLRKRGVLQGGRWVGSLTRSAGGRVIEQAMFRVMAPQAVAGDVCLLVEVGPNSQVVDLEERSFRFGGRSWWMLCPRCGRRCLKLYLPPGAGAYRCRICWKLTYLAAQEAHNWDRGFAAAFLAPLLVETACTPTDLERVMRAERKRR